MAACAGGALVDLAQSQLVLFRHVDEQLHAALPAFAQGQFGEGFVERIFAQVDARQSRQQAQADDGVDQVLQLVVARLGFFLGGADDGHDAGQDQQFVVAAAMLRQAGLQAAVERLRAGQCLLRREYQFGRGGRQFLAILAGAGLHQHGIALHRALGLQCAAQLEVFAFVLQHLQLGRVEEIAAGLVEQIRIVAQAVPQALDDIDVFARALVALRVRHLRGQAEAFRLPVGARGDEVPAGATAADMVERGELARQVERVQIGDGGGGDQADMLGSAGQGGQQGQRFKIIRQGGACQQRGRAFGKAHGIGKEDGVELAPLGHARQVLQRFQPRRLRGIDVGMAPGGDVMPDTLQKCPQPHLSLATAHEPFLERNEYRPRA